MAKVKKPIITENEDLKKEFTYPEGMEFNTNRPLMIGVQGPYEFIVMNEKTYVISTRYKEKLINRDKTEEDIRTKIMTSNPFYDPFSAFTIEEFINKISSLDLEDTKSILEFYNSYGPLGVDGYGTIEGDINSRVIRTFGLHLNTSMESFSFFKEKITEFKNLIQLHEAIQNNDETFLRDYNFDSTAIAGFKMDSSTPKEMLFMAAKRQLMQAINRNSDLINPVVGMVDGEITKFTSATCLLGVFYMRLYEMVTENPKIKKCRYCGDYFIPRKTNANFCPPPEANEKSKCANRYDAMVRRIAQWYFKEGLTVEEIQKKLTKPKSRTVKEIQYILDNYTGKLRK
jgi:hypothetical protein